MDLNQKIQVSLVDHHDNEIGQMEKLEAHQKGLLHRAFSVLIFNDKSELLLQKRAFGKYHSEGLWTNTCCSHPNPGESNLSAAHRRLQEEMGFDCEMKELFYFIYKAELDNNLIEHELKKAISEKPTDFTFWFKVIILEHFDKIKKSIENESL